MRTHISCVIIITFIDKDSMREVKPIKNNLLSSKWQINNWFVPYFETNVSLLLVLSICPTNITAALIGFFSINELFMSNVLTKI